LRLSHQEKQFIEKISAISGKEYKIVQEVLKAFLIATTLEIYTQDSNECELIIPYLCRLKLKFYDKDTTSGMKVVTELEAEPLDGLCEEIKCISEGDISPVEKYIKNQIVKNIQNNLNLEDIEVTLECNA
jgi:hypothetical protein